MRINKKKYYQRQRGAFNNNKRIKNIKIQYNKYTSAPKIYKPKSDRRKKEMSNSTIQDGDFKTFLSIIVRITKQTISKDIEDLNDIIKFDLNGRK